MTIEIVNFLLSIGIFIVGVIAIGVAMRIHHIATRDLNRMIDIVDKMAGIYNEEQRADQDGDGTARRS